MGKIPHRFGNKPVQYFGSLSSHCAFASDGNTYEFLPPGEYAPRAGMPTAEAFFLN